MANSEPRPLRPRFLATAAVLLVVASGGGCDENSTRRAGGIDALLAEYDASTDMAAYQAVLADAGKLERSMRGNDRANAAYVAGLAAYQASELDLAERHLAVASETTDPEQAALADAALGLVRRQQGRANDAAELIEEAFPSLPASERADAARALADAYAAAGDLDDARDWAALARSTPTLTSDGGFALQAGAFREKARADRAARETAGLPGATAFGDVRVHPKSGVGGTYFVVQIGRFATRNDAKLARKHLGRVDMIVADAL